MQFQVYLKPVASYKDLANEKRLQNNLHGQTQNANKSLNGMIWSKCCKQAYAI